jgi:hypothetical protein
MDEKHCECGGNGRGCCGNGSAPLFKGLAVMFILIGLSVFVSSLINALFNPALAVDCMMFGSGTGGLWNVIGLLFALMVLFCIFRNVLHRHCRCGNGCGCGCCGSGKHGSCSCGKDCNCGCNDANGMDKKVSRSGRSK